MKKCVGGELERHARVFILGHAILWENQGGREENEPPRFQAARHRTPLVEVQGA